MIPAPGQKIKIESTAENLRLVERLVEDVCEIYNVNEDNFGNILIAVTEAVNNAIYHGNKGNPKKSVQIGFENGNKKITFMVCDEGAGFDYESLPDPTDPNNIDKINGRGVFLMKHLADKVEFNDNGKEVQLTFNLN
jgi:serine/threonine-protein kinase RsbW